MGGTQAVSPLGKWVTALRSGACPRLLSLRSLALAKVGSPAFTARAKPWEPTSFPNHEDLRLNGYELFLHSGEFSEEQLNFSYV